MLNLYDEIDPKYSLYTSYSPESSTLFLMIELEMDWESKQLSISLSKEQIKELRDYLTLVLND